LAQPHSLKGCDTVWKDTMKIIRNTLFFLLVVSHNKRDNSIELSCIKLLPIGESSRLIN